MHSGAEGRTHSFSVAEKLKRPKFPGKSIVKIGYSILAIPGAFKKFV